MLFAGVDMSKERQKEPGGPWNWGSCAPVHDHRRTRGSVQGSCRKSFICSTKEDRQSCWEARVGQEGDKNADRFFRVC
jgi:hypothetical protein